ncbi:MAG: 3-hydroxyacyl-CoA dehydrogenase NAD-binding domain-containing protein [Pseudomonadales bacterium]
MTEVTVTINDSVAVVSVDNPPVNALSQAVRDGLLQSVSAANNNSEVSAIVLSCAGRTFVAGADIKEFGKPPMEPHLPDVLNAIEAASKPVVVALHGNALGGGLELAMAGHYRVATASCKLGLPETNLGLIPGAGGTQRLPRLAGVNAALEMITSARPVSAAKALKFGLLDEVVESNNAEDVLSAALALAKGDALVKGPRRTRDISVTAPDDSQDVFASWRASVAKKARGQAAPQFAIDSIENSLRMSFDEAIAKEREYFLECKASPQSRAMRHAFFAERSCGKIPGLDASIKPNTVSHVGVIGAGTMGTGIAMCFASAGMQVTLLELSEDNLQRGLALIKKRYQQSQQRGRISELQMQANIELIQGSQNYADFADVDLVVEAAFESMQVKREIFAELDSICRPDTILASNTSYLNINTIADATQHPERVLGMHFFSPAHVMKLLEVVDAERTSSTTLLTALSVAKRIGKIACAVGVCYGFVGNRMYSCYGREANALLLEGATPSHIDAAMQQWGMAMGPLSVTDMSGIDIGYKARRERDDPPNDPLFFRAADLMVEHERLGQKTSAGFYDYADGKKLDDKVAVQLLQVESSERGIKPRDISVEEIQQRLILALINEGAKILEEGIAIRASDIDVIWLNGYGFPRWRGGPMCYADEIGLDNVVAQIDEIHSQASGAAKDYWQAANNLRELASANGRLSEQ